MISLAVEDLLLFHFSVSLAVTRIVNGTFFSVLSSLTFFKVAFYSREAATADSLGRKPQGLLQSRTGEPRRGDTRFGRVSLCRPFGARFGFGSVFLGLTPQAIGCRPYGTKTTHNFKTHASGFVAL